MTRRWTVAVLGATGAVGQRLVRRLHDHPWFELVAVAASERSAGRSYREAVHWLQAEPIPAVAGALEVGAVGDVAGVDIAFSALDAAVAAEVEPQLAAAGVAVVSNASALRDHPRVPLVVPEANADHLGLIGCQDWAAPIVTNPNCATVGLVLALKPLADACGLEAVQVTTLQAVSGAGYPGVPALDIVGNALPEIRGEEAKLEAEPRRILGRLTDDGIEPLAAPFSAQANRVPVVDGHLLSVSVRLTAPATPEEATAIMAAFESPVAELGLPSAPARPLEVIAGFARPQPRLDAGRGGGMTVTVGRIRPCPVLGLRFVALVHNLERGAAGAAVLNGELLAASGRLG